jgi:hypothetical protein
VHVYVTKAFRRFQRKERISNASLRESVARAADGLIDADLGSGLIKQRVPRPGQGRRGSYRTIIAYRTARRAVFLFGFAKNAQANIDDASLTHWRLIAGDLLRASEEAIAAAIASDELTEVRDD